MSLYSRLQYEQEVEGITFYLTDCAMFAVSACGKVMGRSGKVLKPKCQGKYLVVSYQAEPKKIRHKYVHRMVAQVFVTNPGYPDVNHINGNRYDNACSNLEWVSPKQNHAHAIEHGLVYNLPTKGQRGFQCRA